MATLQEILSALRVTLETIPELNVYSNPASKPEFPCVNIHLVSIDFTVTQGKGSDLFEFDLEVLVSGNHDDKQAELNELVSGFTVNRQSIRETLWDNRKLGLADTDASLIQLLDYGRRLVSEGVEGFGAILRVKIVSSGTRSGLP